MKKLQKARVELLKNGLSKSGANSHFRNYYFELQDFLPQVNKIFNDLGLYSHFNLEKEYAKLTVTDLESQEKLQFKMPVQVLPNPTMQNLGAITTYAKRYLYMNALEIAESDMIDGENNGNPKNEALESKTPKTRATTKKSSAKPQVKAPKKEATQEVEFNRNEVLKVFNEKIDITKIKGWLESRNLDVKTFEEIPDNALKNLWFDYLNSLK